MHSSAPHVFVFALAFAVIPRTGTKAQQLSDLPSCAEPALLAAIQGSGCELTDAKCICSDPALIPALRSSIQQSCSPADQAAVEAFGSTYCGTAVVSSMAASAKSETVTEAPPSSAYATTSLPSAISVSIITSTPSGALITDSSSSPSLTSTTGTNRGPRNHTATSTAKPTNGTHSGGAAMESGMSLAALAVAVGAMGWVFAKV